MEEDLVMVGADLGMVGADLRTLVGADLLEVVGADLVVVVGAGLVRGDLGLDFLEKSCQAFFATAGSRPGT